MRRPPWWLILVLAATVASIALALGWRSRPPLAASPRPAWSVALPGRARLEPAAGQGLVVWGGWGAEAIGVHGHDRLSVPGPVQAVAGGGTELWTAAGSRVVATTALGWWSWQLPGVVASLWPAGSGALAEVRQGTASQLIQMSAQGQPQWYVDIAASVAWSTCTAPSGQAVVLGGLDAGGNAVSLGGLLSGHGWRWRWAPPGDGPVLAVACGQDGTTWWLLPHRLAHLNAGGQLLWQADLVGAAAGLATGPGAVTLVSTGINWWWRPVTLVTAVGATGTVLWARRLAGRPLGRGVVPDGQGWAAVTTAGVWYVGPDGAAALVSRGQPDGWTGQAAGLGLLEGRELVWYPAPDGP